MRTILAAATALAMVAPAYAAPRDNIIAAVQKFDDAFNAGDGKSIAAACADDAVVIDDFPPHLWQGGNGCAAWFADFTRFATTDGLANAAIKLGKPWQAVATGDRGYVVVPVRLTYTEKGKKVVESGSAWTFALRKVGGLWKIAGWAWAQHT